MTAALLVILGGTGLFGAALPETAEGDAVRADAIPLEGTHWTLVELGGATVVAEGPHEAYLVLEAEGQRVAGAGGCNRLTGRYERDDDRLRFQPLAATRRTCLQGMDIEAAFLAALETVRRFRIDEERLELLDSAGRTLTALEARVAASGR